ncbi:MAG: hypothetical protein ACREQ4_00430 [Candidatus Binataceae bacterium]
MKLFKMAALAVVAGAGLALAGTPVLAQNAASTSTSSSIGAGSSTSIEGAGSNTSNVLSASKGTAGGAGIATPLGSAALGVSKAGGTTNADSTTNNSTANADTASNYNGTTTLVPGGGTTTAGTTNNDSTTKNGSQLTDAYDHAHLWVDAEHSQGAHAKSASATNATGTSLAALFVFGQNQADSTIEDGSTFGDVTFVSSGDFNGSSGTIALNQVAGIANQQGNTMATALELSADNSTVAGSNTVNVETNQNLIDNSVTEDGKSTADSATILPNAFQNVTGSIAFNQASGSANQQVNQMTLLH